jgi:hypothetical protein
MKKRIEIIEVFMDKGLGEGLLYLILKEVNKRLNSRRLRGFNRIELGKYAFLGEIFTQ